MEKWKFGCDLDAFCTVPVSPGLTEADTYDAIGKYLDYEAGLGKAVLEDFEYELTQNADGTISANVHVYATCETEAYGKDKEECTKNARSNIETEDFGILTQSDTLHYELRPPMQTLMMSDILVKEFKRIIDQNKMYLNPQNTILNRDFILVAPENTEYIVHAHLNYDNKADLTFYEAPAFEKSYMYRSYMYPMSSDYGKQAMDMYCSKDKIIGAEADVPLDQLANVLNSAIGLEERLVQEKNEERKMHQIENIKVLAAHEEGIVHNSDSFRLERDKIVTQVSFDGATVDQIAKEVHMIGAGLSDFRLLTILDHNAETVEHQLSFCVHVNGEEVTSKTIRLSPEEGAEIEHQIAVLQKTELLDDLKSGKAWLGCHGNVYECVGEQQPLGLIFQDVNDVLYSFEVTEEELLHNDDYSIYIPEKKTFKKENKRDTTPMEIAD